MVFDIGVPVAKTTPRPPFLLLQVAGLHEHVEGSIAVGVRHSGNPAHLRRITQIFVQVSFIHEELINAELLKCERLVFRIAICAFFEANYKPLLGLFQFLNDPAISSFDRPWRVECFRVPRSAFRGSD